MTLIVELHFLLTAVVIGGLAIISGFEAMGLSGGSERSLK
jgi:hypothetical protein